MDSLFWVLTIVFINGELLEVGPKDNVIMDRYSDCQELEEFVQEDYSEYVAFTTCELKEFS